MRAGSVALLGVASSLQGGTSHLRAEEAAIKTTEARPEDAPSTASCLVAATGPAHPSVLAASVKEPASRGWGGWLLQSLAQADDAGAAQEQHMQAMMQAGRGAELLLDAAGAADAPLVRRLLDGGAPASASAFGETVLMVAAQQGSAECVRLLLEAGASANAATPTGRTALMFATIADGPGSAEAMAVLLRAGHADVSAADEEGVQALMLAAQQGSCDKVKILLDAGAQVNAVNVGGFTALHGCVANGHVAAARLLIAAGAHISAPSRAAFTPFMLACMYDRAEAARLLIQAGACVHAATEEGLTALMICARRGFEQCMDVCLAAGARLGAVDHNGATAAAWAVQGGHHRLAAMLAT